MAWKSLPLLLALLSLSSATPVRLLPSAYSLLTPIEGRSMNLTAEVLRQTSPMTDFSLTFWVKSDQIPILKDAILRLYGSSERILEVGFPESGKIAADVQYYEIGGGVYHGGRVTQSYLDSDRNWHFIGISVSLENKALVLCMDTTCREITYTYDRWVTLSTSSVLEIALKKGSNDPVYTGRMGDMVLYTNSYLSGSELVTVKTAKSPLSGCTSVLGGMFYDSCQEFALLVGLTDTASNGYYIDIPIIPRSYTLGNSTVFYGRSTYSHTDYTLSGHIGSAGQIVLSGTGGTATLIVTGSNLHLDTSNVACSDVNGFIYFELEVTTSGASLKCGTNTVTLSWHISDTATISLLGKMYNILWTPVTTTPSPTDPSVLGFDQGCSAGTGGGCTVCYSANYYLQAGKCSPCHPYCFTCTSSGHMNCLTCAPNTYLQPGFTNYCRPFCPTGFSPSPSQVCVPSSNLLRTFTLENNLIGDFDLPTGERLCYGFDEKYYPDYEFLDPLPVNKRGLYFTHSVLVMRYENGLRLGTDFSFEFWLLPITTTDILTIGMGKYYILSLGIEYLTSSSTYGKKGIRLCLDTTLGQYPCTPTELPIPTMLTRWYHIGLSVSYSPGSQLTQAVVSVDQESRTYTFNGYFEMPETTNLEFGLAGAMYLYSFSFMNQPRSLAEFASMEGSNTICPLFPLSVGHCLPTCKPLEFVDAAGDCQPCLPECEFGCVRADTCSFCADPLCVKCSGYEASDVCLQCIDGATVQSGECVCPTGQLALNNTCVESCEQGFYPDYVAGICKSCSLGCLECDAVKCGKCKEEFLLEDGKCSCGGGFYVSPALTCEKCDSICQECSIVPSNCTACFTPSGYYLNDNKCLSCQLTPGYSGGLGVNILRQPEESLSHYINQVCHEICGDGILQGQLACDDGNLVNGDGCSSECIVETSWTCVNVTNESVCSDTTMPTAKLSYMGLVDGRYDLVLEFSENITLPESINIHIDIDLVQLYTFTTEIVRNENQFPTILLHITPQEHIPANSLVTLSFSDQSSLHDSSGNILSSNEITASLKDSFTPASSIRVEQATQVTGPMTGTVAAIAVMNSAFGSSNFNAVWSLVEILQIINYILYMGAELPDNLKTFLRQLSFANFEFIPSFFETETDSFPAPPLPFASEDVGTDFLINIGNMVTIWTALLAAYVLIYILCHCLPSVSLLNRLKGLFIYSVFIRCGTESFLQLALGVCLQFREIGPRNTFGGFSVAVSVIAALYLCFLLLMTVFKVSLQNPLKLSQKEYRSRFGSLYETFKLENKITRSFLLIQNIRRLFFVLFLVFLWEHPLVQAILCFVLCLTYLAALVIWRPEERWWVGNCTQIVTEVGLSLVHCLICVLADSDISADLRTDIGWASLAILLLIIFTNIGVLAYLQFQATSTLLKRVNTYLSRQGSYRPETLADTDRVWPEGVKPSAAAIPYTDPSFGDPGILEPETALDIRPVFHPNRRRPG